jgi:hypothetical protein
MLTAVHFPRRWLAEASRASSTLRATLVLGLVLASASSGCKGKAVRAKEEAAARPVVEGFTESLGNVRTSLPREGEALTETACSPTAIAEALGTSDGKAVSFVDRRFLDEIAGGPRRAFGMGNKSHEEDDFLVSADMQLFSSDSTPEKPQFADAAEQVRSRSKSSGNVVVVLDVRTNVEPQWSSEKGVLLDKFEPGQFDAWALVYTLTGAKRLCQAHVVATNGNVVWTKRGDNSLKHDYVKMVGEALNAALQRVAPPLRAYVQHS